MKAVLISIQPKWCEFIASGKKTVEVRKTKPKIETPFKCYIYCTQGNGYLESVNGKVQKLNYLELDLNVDNYVYELNGKVIGEFVCDTFIIDKTFGHDALFNAVACLSDADAASYCLNKEMYGWHISDLVIYDKPKELRDFKRVCDGNCQSCQYAIWQTSGWAYEPYIVDCKPITRPPQSWCYVEELKGE